MKWEWLRGRDEERATIVAWLRARNTIYDVFLANKLEEGAHIPVPPRETATAWLIERTDVHLCYSDGASLRWVTFTDPHAWRFASKGDAEGIIETAGLEDVQAVEHMWVLPSPQPADNDLHQLHEARRSALTEAAELVRGTFFPGEGQEEIRQRLSARIEALAVDKPTSSLDWEALLRGIWPVDCEQGSFIPTCRYCGTQQGTPDGQEFVHAETCAWAHVKKALAEKPYSPFDRVAFDRISEADAEYLRGEPVPPAKKATP